MNLAQLKTTHKISVWGITTFCLLIAVAALFPDMASAVTATGADPDKNNLVNVACNVIILLQGNISRGVAAGGVIFLGFSLFLGKISWGTAMALGLGLGAIFGAQQLVNLASGGDKLSCTTKVDASTS